MSLLKFCNKVIEYSFYSLFFLVPLTFTDKTSELFEFNKMWVAFGFTIVIGSAWFTKMILQKKFIFQRTPLDIPIGLFLISQLISTIFSLDTHTSIWGYYSRFNGGFLSILSYIFLYYAFLSNLSYSIVIPAKAGIQNKNYIDSHFHGNDKGKYVSSINDISHGIKMVKRLLLVSLFSGLIVALWGLPSHFGYDPTCLMFRGTFDVSCWTDAFQPKVRIFSTLGQPNWMAAYLAILLPIAIAFLLSNKSKISNKITKPPSLRDHEMAKQSSWRLPRSARNDNTLIGTLNLKSGILFILTSLFFLDILYTRSNSGFLGLMGGILLFLTIILLNSIKSNLHKILVSFSGLIIFSSWILLKWKDLQIINLVSTIFIVIFLANLLYISIKSKESILYRYKSVLFIVLGTLVAFSLFIGTPMTPKLTDLIPKPSSTSITQKAEQTKQPQGPALEVGGTDSGKIRLIVWKGALDVWRANPIFGSGVETYAYAYYKFRPSAHNMTSEWDYLYNKAHNEYLNYLATTGAFGLGSYLLMIGTFLFLILKKLLFSEYSENSDNQSRLNRDQIVSKSENQQFRISDKSDLLKHQHSVSLSIPSFLTIALLASYASILISNFFGFSVVIVNLYMFMIPAFVLILSGMIKTEENVIPPSVIPVRHHEVRSTLGVKTGIQNIKHIDSRFRGNDKKQANQLSGFQWFGIISINFIALYLIFNLFRFWQADTAYAIGNNLDKVGQYQQGYTKLHEAVSIRSNEPVFKDELTFNNAVLAAAILSQKPENITPETKQTVENLIKEAFEISNNVVTNHPNNIVSWKTRVRMFYTLSRVQPQYLNDALTSIAKAAELAPTDAKIYYNLGVLYGQTGNPQKAIEVLSKTVELKPDYRDAYYALGLFYRESAVDKNQKIVKPEFQQKAVETMKFILTNFNKEDLQAKQALQSWGAQ